MDNIFNVSFKSQIQYTWGEAQSLYRGTKTSTTISLQVEGSLACTRISKAYCYKSTGRASSLHEGDWWKSDISHLTSLGASPTGCIYRSRRDRNFPKSRSLYIEGLRVYRQSSEFFHVPESIH